MFKIGDQVLCNIELKADYTFDQTKPLTVVGIAGNCAYIQQAGLTHSWRRWKGNQEPCLYVSFSKLKAVTGTTVDIRMSKIIAKIKQLDKRFTERKAA